MPFRSHAASNSRALAQVRLPVVVRAAARSSLSCIAACKASLVAWKRKAVSLVDCSPAIHAPIRPVQSVPDVVAVAAAVVVCSVAVAAVVAAVAVAAVAVYLAAVDARASLNQLVGLLAPSAAADCLADAAAVAAWAVAAVVVCLAVDCLAVAAAAVASRICWPEWAVAAADLVC